MAAAAVTLALAKVGESLHWLWIAGAGIAFLAYDNRVAIQRRRDLARQANLAMPTEGDDRWDEIDPGRYGRWYDRETGWLQLLLILLAVFCLFAGIMILDRVT